MICSKILLLGFFFFVVYIKFLFGSSSSDESRDLKQNTTSSRIESTIERFSYVSNQRAVVKLPKYGLLQGSLGSTAWTNRTILQFLNVPYAESPSGRRRFKAPVPIKPWNGIRNAENYGTKCPTFQELKQMSQSERDSKDLEDCLIMAVFSTNLNASFPVMVYIHGGGFYSNNADNYPPNYMIERDIILVVIQFRLDALGFLSTSSEEIPGNAGLLDSIQALKFVKENIVHFGGDPNQITIFGQSSGAAMVSALVISPGVPGDLFHRAIIQSGSIFGNWAYTTDPVRDAKGIAQAAGLNPNQTIAALNRAFLTMSVFDLLKAVDTYQVNGFMARRILVGGRSLTIGGPSNLLPDLPQNIVKSPSYNRSIPIIVGTTKDDGSYVATVIYDMLAANNKLNDKNFMVNHLVDELCQLSEIEDDTGTFASLVSLTFWTNEQLRSGDFGKCAPGIIDMLGMAAFKAPGLKFAQMNAHNNPFGTYLYTFDYQGEYTRFGYGEDTSHYPFPGGVTHSDDLIYLFPDPPNVAELNEDDKKIAQLMVDLWTSFAISGVPKIPQNQNGTEVLQWQPFSGQSSAYLHINKELRIGEDYRQEFTVRVQEHQNKTKN